MSYLVTLKVMLIELLVSVNLSNEFMKMNQLLFF